MGRIAASESDVPRPVVKWAGGKAKLAEKLVQWMPERMGTYVEPFCGGGAVFFRLAAEPRRRFERAILADKNEHLIALYRAIQTRIDDLVAAIADYSNRFFRLDAKRREALFYEVRELAPASGDVVARGARLIFLNKTCYNGLWRENASGKNNVPFGRYVNPKILDVRALVAAHRALQDVDLVVDDFEKVTKKLGKDDFAYFDPPYVPVSKTANFTSYAKDGFGPDDQKRLRNLLTDLHRRGVRAMLSNAKTPDTEELYRDFEWKAVPMPRAINSVANKRGDVEELVVFNHPPARPTRKAAS